LKDKLKVWNWNWK